jgi:hypothetical protein
MSTANPLSFPSLPSQTHRQIPFPPSLNINNNNNNNTILSSSSSQVYISPTSSSAASTVSDEEEEEEDDDLAEQEWQESLAQLALLFNLVLLPFAGKYFGRRFAYFGI